MGDRDPLIPGRNKQAVDRLGTPVDKLYFEAGPATPVKPTGQALWTGRRERLVDQAVIVKRNGVSGGVRMSSEGKHFHQVSEGNVET